MSVFSLAAVFTCKESKDQNGEKERVMAGVLGSCLQRQLRPFEAVLRWCAPEEPPMGPVSWRWGESVRNSGRSTCRRLTNTDIDTDLSTCNILKYASLEFIQKSLSPLDLVSQSVAHSPAAPAICSFLLKWRGWGDGFVGKMLVT